MNCTEVRSWLIRKIDAELSDFESRELDSHLAECASCRQEYRLLNLPHQIAQVTPSFKPSPFFYSRLKTSIENEAEKAIGWQFFWGPARRTIPALVGITLVLFSVFAYLEQRSPEMDLYKAYEQAFVAGNHPQQLLISEQVPVTDAGVLSAIYEQQIDNQRNPEQK